MILDAEQRMAATEKHTQIAAGIGIREGTKRLGWGSRPALLLIDVCAAYWTPGSPLDLSGNPAGAASPDSMRRLLRAARSSSSSKKVPVVWAQVRYNHPQMLDGAVQAQKTKTILAWQDGDVRGLDAPLEGLVPDQQQEGDTLVLKRNPSAFFGTTLATELHLLGVDTLVICGVSTSGCVRATAQDAMCFGYRTMVSPLTPPTILQA
jgi:nicotinamidase-related amidase